MPAKCHVCGTRLEPPRRKYCQVHAHQASRLWKREQRRKWSAAGDPYWLSDWKHLTAGERRAYFRKYMREYRARVAARCGSSARPPSSGEEEGRTVGH